MWYTKEKKKSEKLEGDSSPFTCVIYFYISLKDYLRQNHKRKEIKRTRKDHRAMDKGLIPIWDLFEKWGKLHWESELWNKAMNY